MLLIRFSDWHATLWQQNFAQHKWMASFDPLSKCCQRCLSLKSPLPLFKQLLLTNLSTKTTARPNLAVYHSWSKVLSLEFSSPNDGHSVPYYHFTSVFINNLCEFVFQHHFMPNTNSTDNFSFFISASWRAQVIWSLYFLFNHTTVAYLQYYIVPRQTYAGCHKELKREIEMSLLS